MRTPHLLPDPSQTARPPITRSLARNASTSKRVYIASSTTRSRKVCLFGYHNHVGFGQVVDEEVADGEPEPVMHAVVLDVVF